MKRASTYFPKPGDVPDNWRIFDADGQTLGRLARNIAVVLQGKDKPTYTNHKEIKLRDLIEEHPDRVIQLAVKGMLPTNKLGRQMLKRMKVYAGPNHNHIAQTTKSQEQE